MIENRKQKTEDRGQIKRKRGSLTIEYAVLIAIIVAVLLGMQTYIKRAICGKWREAADTLGHGRQYEPGVTRINGEIK